MVVRRRRNTYDMLQNEDGVWISDQNKFEKIVTRLDSWGLGHFVLKAGFSQLTEEEMDILKLDMLNHELHLVIKQTFGSLERMAFKQFSTKVNGSMLMSLFVS